MNMDEKDSKIAMLEAENYELKQQIANLKKEKDLIEDNLRFVMRDTSTQENLENDAKDQMNYEEVAGKAI